MTKLIYQWVMYATMEGVCNQTGNKIRVGDIILYTPPIKDQHTRKVIQGGRVYCTESKEFINAVTKSVHTGFKIEFDPEPYFNKI